jgi:hypothetical protein
MYKKKILFMNSLVFLLFCAGAVLGQPASDWKNAGKEEVRHLGRNLAVNLVVGPDVDQEGFTIITATEHFLAETELERGKKRIALRFEGKIKLRDSQLIIGERALGGGQSILVYYRIKMDAVGAPAEGGFAFALEGSALLDENEQVVIARSRDMVLRLKIAPLE